MSLSEKLEQEEAFRGKNGKFNYCHFYLKEAAGDRTGNLGSERSLGRGQAVRVGEVFTAEAVRQRRWPHRQLF